MPTAASGPVVGQVNVPLNEPSEFIEGGVPIGEGEAQSLIPIPMLAVPLVSGGQGEVLLLTSCMPVPPTVNDWPTGPCEGIIVNPGGVAVHA